jgi:ribose-phosphate pyrophosphokinase
MLLLNNAPIKHFYFSGGEIQVQLPELILEERVKLLWKPTKPDHIILLGLTVNALHELGITDIDLDILYLPYGRQDRVCSPGEANSLKFICQFINALDVSCVRIWDIHNADATACLLPNNYIWHWEAFDVFARYNLLNNFDLSNLILCAPDKGAKQRVDKIVNHFQLDDAVYLEKNRNPTDGRITSLYFNPHNRSVNSYDVMVVDDICDAGATFIMAADTLKAQGAEKLYLYVTHGIFSEGLDELLQHYEHIYCHHVLHDSLFKNDSRLTIIQEYPIVP